MAEAMKLTKGEQTQERLLDAAERLFAQKGYEGTSLRDVASAAGIREPGIYNYFKNKEALYAEVLERGLRPMADAIDQVLAQGVTDADILKIADVMTDLLCEHPSMAALFHQALISENEGLANEAMNRWLAELFEKGGQLYDAPSDAGNDRIRFSVRMIALFNLSTGYFLSQKFFDQMRLGDLMDKENIREQKNLLRKIIRLFLLEG